MARVTVEQSQKIVQKTGKGVKMFSFDPGNLYHVLFLGEQVGVDEKGSPLWEPIMYINPTHQVRGLATKGFEVRCADANLNTSNVILTDKEGNLLKNPVTGRVLNDGTCPYCHLEKDNAKWVFKQREKYIDEHPEATEKEIKSYTRKLFEKSPVRRADQIRVFLVAVFELDSKGKPVTDREGNKVYQIQAMKFTEHRFTAKLLEQVGLVTMNLEDENDKGIAWHEYYFKFPKTDSKMTSGKDLTISAVQYPILASDPGLKDQLLDEIDEKDLDALEDQIYIYKLKNLEEMERDIALYRTKIDADLDEDELQDIREDFKDDDELTDDDVRDIMGESIDQSKDDSEVDDITDEDIKNLM